MEPFDLIATIAAAQDGVVTAEQALDAGLTRDRIRQLCRSGRSASVRALEMSSDQPSCSS